jgi:hypothetical protein
VRDFRTHYLGRCNLCGAKFNEFDWQQDFHIHQRIGYGSIYDGDCVHLRLCCDCFDRLVEACEISPIKEVAD